MCEPVIYVNGKFVPESKATISVLDHAVLYGDGVFETALAWEGSVFKLDDHLDRFYRSMHALSLTCSVSREQLISLILEAIRLNNVRNAYIKWIVTRGTNGKPLMEPAGCVPNLIILVQPYLYMAAKERIEGGLRVKTAAVRRPSGQVLDAHIKSLNYLNLILAKLEAKAAGADEALLLDSYGRICEAPGYNVFVVRGQQLLTPCHDILAGITRQTVMELAGSLELSVESFDLELYDAYTADEVFFCSTAGGLLPVVELDGRTIGSGKPGPIFGKLSKAYLELIASGRYGIPIDRVVRIGD
ncbi:branched-chain-amino-acid transaminase [Paraburkholderia sp.]|uniref:branched-chain-amino-acid transaminase n=1 Tax=Paraburkholderia sp. TaxID=1926495 RepID=UPI0039E2E938